MKPKVEALNELKNKTVQKYFELIGSNYKIAKRELFFKTFTQKKYYTWFEDMIDDICNFFKNDLVSVNTRLDKIKGNPNKNKTTLLSLLNQLLK